MISLHSLNQISTGDLIAELLARGVDVSSAVHQMQAERKAQRRGNVISIEAARRARAG